MSKIANVNVDTYRHFGRMGLGATFGSKNLKAIQVTAGDSTRNISDLKKYFTTYRELYDKVTNTSVMSKYHDLGTAINVKVLNKIGSLPTRNLQQTEFESVEEISGERFAEKNLVRKVACVGCPIGCIHIGQVRRQFAEGYDYESYHVSYDYELISAFGSLIGIDNTDDILELISEAEEIGFDVIAAGCCLSWATEAYDKGIITDTETQMPIKFGDKETYIKVMRKMGESKTEFYTALANGVSEVTAKYGGSDFGLQIAKNEMPQYHTGYGSIVGYVCGARHSHLDNGGYSLDQKMKEFDKDALIDNLFKEEVNRNIINSMIGCLFARGLYDNPTILKALAAVGIDMTEEGLNETAERICATKLRIKRKLGFNECDVEVPKRILETDGMRRKIDPRIVKELVQMFYNKNQQLLEQYKDEQYN